MSTEIYKRVVYNDGEGITYGDANDAQDYLRAVVWDKIVQSLIGNVKLSGGVAPDLNGSAGIDMPTHLAYCLHGGSAYVRPGSAANKVQIAPGVLMQKVGTTDGNAPTILSYYFQGTEEVAIAAGATNPRVDLVQMQLAYLNSDLQSRDFQDATTHVVTTTSVNKKRYVQCTLSVKQGTAAASPTIPDPDSGYVAVASVYVGSTYATGTALQFGQSQDSGTNRAFVMDQRMPINVQPTTTPCTAMKLVTGWTLSADGQTLDTNATPTELHIPSLKGPSTSRLVGVAVCLYNGEDAATNGFRNYTASVGFIANAINKIPTGFNGSYLRLIPYYTFEGNYTDTTTGVTINPSATNKIGVPIWSNGQMGPFIVNGVLTMSPASLEFKWVSGASNALVHCTFGAFHWYWAEGI